MDVVNPLSISIAQDNAAHRLLAAAEQLLAARSGKAESAFVGKLYSGAAPEDVTQYGAADLADLAAETWQWVVERAPHTPKIRLYSPSSGATAQTVSVVEIVNDDMPFLLDSVLGELSENGLEPLFVAHPIIGMKRDAAGRLIAWSAELGGDGGWKRESVIHIHVARLDDEPRRAAIVAALGEVLNEVRLAVQDWAAMRERANEAIAALATSAPPLPREEVAEAVEFLQWLVSANFTFLGMRAYALAGDGIAYEPDMETALGILRSPAVKVLRRGRDLVSITPEVREFLNEPKALIITKANVRSRVHRRVHMDYIGIKRFDAAGRLAGELRILGLFTATVYTKSACSIPYLRRKVGAVLARAGFDPESHSGQALLNVLETYPRDELFQIDEDTLYQFALAVMHLAERPRVRVLPRADRFDRFVSVLVFVPRERYASTIRVAISDHLAAVYNGRLAAFYPYFPEGALVRVHYIIARYAGETPRPDALSIEQAVTRIVLTWQDRLAIELTAARNPSEARRLLARYGAAFSGAYRADYPPATAVVDIRTVEQLSPDRPLAVDFYRLASEGANSVRLKVWSYGRPIPLSERVPALEHMAFKVVEESTYPLHPPAADEADFWLHDMRLERVDDGAVDLDVLQERLGDCFLMVMRGLAENDGYNALALTAGLAWRDIALIRTLSRYLRQVGIPYSQDYMWATLTKYGSIAEKIVALFYARFEPRPEMPADARAAKQAALAGAIDGALRDVASLDEDRIIRRFVNAVQAAVRTTFYQLDEAGRPKPVIAIKFDSRRVEGMALPRPLLEVFLYSPRMEAVHLRFGKVARGGIRWSDRPQDFRTEILGLVKAQQVKNAVIVPVGAKGGFVPKALPAGDREAIQAEGVASYRTFVSALLDITDDVAPTGIVGPPEVVRYDDNDAYLVVAAYKGTATFSDIANDIAERRGFWLGDAFASGGSAGYDHKKMGITARGAWESVKRHFREMNVDIGRALFTVAGVGDMSGDVFGNGMLQERTIRLIAAFDHRDIFIDPDPDPEASFAERQRLFEQPRSSWQDYDRELISAGGGVYSRTAKEIVLSAQVQTALGFPQARVTPAELMSVILRAPVDLLFFGGIGTYVRAADEANEQVGDRANDAIRIVSADLRCKVIGEGANLGMTQLGRIAAALRGVRLNTDAIDNSAGVNTSDLEVNVKIALNTPMREGLLDRAERDVLLAAMTDEVARIVLRNNYQQTQAISLAQRRGFEDLGFQQRLMQTFERRGLLDRAVEFLPDDVELAERRRRGEPLTRPELAVLLAHAKLSLNHDLLDSPIPDNAYLARELARYFPQEITRRYPEAVGTHRLRREIIATQLANSMINRGGPMLVVRIADQTGVSADRIAAAFAAVRDSYDMIAVNTAIEALDNQIAGDVQLGLLAVVQNLLHDRMVWVLRNLDLSGGLAGLVDHYRAGIARVAAALDRILTKEALAALTGRALELTKAGLPQPLARRLADLPLLAAAADAVLVADRTGRPVEDVAATYFAADAFFQIDRLSAAARKVAISDYFDRLAVDRALDSIGDAERRITPEMMRAGAVGEAAVHDWVKARGQEVDRVRRTVHDILSSDLTLSKLTVAASMLGDLARLG